MRTLIDVPRFVWGKVRDFATVQDLTISSAVEQVVDSGIKFTWLHLN